MSVSETERTQSAPSLLVPEKDPRRWVIFGVVSLALFMGSIDQTIVATALPDLQHELHAAVNWSSWTITVYALGQVIVMPVAGALADLYGRKRVFLTAVAIFTTASLACGLVSNIYVLVALRAVQALGGGAFMPSATGLVADVFGQDRDRAIGMFTSIFPIGGVVGPVLGGVFTTYWSWRGIFLVNIPIGIALVLAGRVLLPKAETRSRRPKLDLVGIALMATMLLGAMLAITDLGGGSGITAPEFVAPVVVAVLAGVAFVRHICTAENPFVDPRLLRGRQFAAMNAFNFLFGAAVLGFGALVPLYAETRYGLSALSGGTLLTARAVGIMFVAAGVVYLLRRLGYRLPIVVGSLVIAAGLLALGFEPPFGTPYVWLALGAGLTGIGMGIAMPAANNAALNLAPDRTAAVSGLRGMFRLAGAITGISVTTAVIAQSANPGVAQGHVFQVFAAVVVLVLPLAFLIKDHRGSW